MSIDSLSGKGFFIHINCPSSSFSAFHAVSNVKLILIFKKPEFKAIGRKHNHWDVSEIDEESNKGTHVY